MRIHLTGGVGAGKSSVLRFLEEEYGAKILRADDLAKELMEPGEEGYRRVVELLGKDILAADGTIDRAAMAERIYHDDSARAGGRWKRRETHWWWPRRPFPWMKNTGTCLIIPGMSTRTRRSGSNG